jgi:hypothetical protein
MIRQFKIISEHCDEKLDEWNDGLMLLAAKILH